MQQTYSYTTTINRTDDEEILLGDVIISDGFIEYDFGGHCPINLLRKILYRIVETGPILKLKRC
jgi:hypothetical protein